MGIYRLDSISFERRQRKIRWKFLDFLLRGFFCEGFEEIYLPKPRAATNNNLIIEMKVFRLRGFRQPDSGSGTSSSLHQRKGLSDVEAAEKARDRTTTSTETFPRFTRSFRLQSIFLLSAITRSFHSWKLIKLNFDGSLTFYREAFQVSRR